MAKSKVTWDTMEDSSFIPARTFDIPMPRPRKPEAELIRSLAGVAEQDAGVAAHQG